MTKSLTHLSLICLIFLGCNSPDESYRNGIADAKETLRKQDEKVRKSYAESFQVALHNDGDSSHRKMYIRLDSSTAAGVHYMDSIYGEMSFQADHDPNNFDYVKILFLYKGVGDTLFSTLSRVNDLAQSIAAQTGRLGSRGQSQIDRTKPAYSKRLEGTRFFGNRPGHRHGIYPWLYR